MNSDKLHGTSGDDFDFASKGITADVVDEHGNTLLSSSHKTKRQGGRYFVHLLKVAITHIGLTLLLLGYLLAGGYLFRTLEINNEVQECNSKMDGYIKILNSSTLRVLGTVKSTDSNDRAEQLVRNIMVGFAQDMFVLDFKPSTDCSDILKSTYGSKWNLVNSVYFCVTVLTTIGYGHIAPTTYWGRITCIIYAVIGIPFMLIYLAIIGNLLARAFRFVFVNIICCRCFYDIIRRRRQKRRERLLKWEEDLREHEEEEARRRGLPLPPRKVQPVVVDDEEDLEDDFNEVAREKLSVPLTISVCVLFCYTMIGAAIFPLWEQWTMVDAAYFSFVTISTIGFGDLVPGNGRLNEPQTMVELVVGGLYMLFGLSLLSMCLNLMKDELVAKAKYMAKLFGIVTRPKKKDSTKSDKTNDNGEDDQNDENHQLDFNDPYTDDPYRTKDNAPINEKGFSSEINFDNKAFVAE